MELDDDWWKSDGLANEVYAYLRHRETCIPNYLHQSPQLNSRRHLVDWLAIICQSRQLSSRCQHLAVLLMDLFMDHHSVTESLIKLVALGCLSVAAKFEDRESRVPGYKQLRELAVPNVYTNQLLMNMEIKVLHFFEWTIGFPTAAHFGDYFVHVSVAAGDFCCDKPVLNALESAKEYVHKYVVYFLEISLQDHKYRQYRPSRVCAACVASARSCLQMAPLWSMTLQKVTKYTMQQLQPLVQMMLKTHAQDSQMSRLSKLTESPSSTGSSLTVTPASTPDTTSDLTGPNSENTSLESLSTNSLMSANLAESTPVVTNRFCDGSITETAESATSGEHLFKETACSYSSHSLMSLESCGGDV